MGVDFSGKNVVIVGASSGIGKTLAEEFARDNANLLIMSEVDSIFDVARDLQNTRKLAVHAKKVDISDRKAVFDAFAECPFARINALIQTAGFPSLTPIDDHSDETAAVIRRMFDVNTLGVYWLIQAATPYLGDGSRVVLTSSCWADTGGEAGASIYIASKAALHGLARNLAVELGQRGITVNSVAPGFVKTRLASEDNNFRNVLKGRGKLETRELVGAYQFLASEQSSCTTGLTLYVDAGHTLGHI